jgi:hypothetical protein
MKAPNLGNVDARYPGRERRYCAISGVGLIVREAS